MCENRSGMEKISGKGRHGITSALRNLAASGKPHFSGQNNMTQGHCLSIREKS